MIDHELGRGGHGPSRGRHRDRARACAGGHFGRDPSIGIDGEGRQGNAPEGHGRGPREARSFERHGIAHLDGGRCERRDRGRYPGDVQAPTGDRTVAIQPVVVVHEELPRAAPIRPIEDGEPKSVGASRRRRSTLEDIADRLVRARCDRRRTGHVGARGVIEDERGVRGTVVARLLLHQHQALSRRADQQDLDLVSGDVRDAGERHVDIQDGSRARHRDRRGIRVRDPRHRRISRDRDGSRVRVHRSGGRPGRGTEEARDQRQRAHEGEDATPSPSTDDPIHHGPTFLDPCSWAVRPPGPSRQLGGRMTLVNGPGPVNPPR